MPDNDKSGDVAPETKAMIEKAVAEAVAAKEKDIQALKASHNKTLSERDTALTKLRRDLELKGVDDSDDDADAKTDLGKTRGQISKRHALEDQQKSLEARETALKESHSQWETSFLASGKTLYKAQGVPDEVLDEAQTVAELHKLAKAYLSAVTANGKGGTTERGTGRVGATDGKPASTVDPMEAIKLAIKQGRAATFGT